MNQELHTTEEVKQWDWKSSFDRWAKEKEAKILKLPPYGEVNPNYNPAIELAEH